MRTLAMLAAAGLLSVGATAYARSEIEARSTEVSLKGLDRSSPKDMSVLYARIEEAARRVCSHSSDTWSPARRADRDTCVRNAVAGAVARTDAAELTAVHEAALNGGRTITAAIR